MTDIGKRNEITDLSLNFQGYVPERSPGVRTESLGPARQADEGVNVNSEGPVAKERTCPAPGDQIL